MKRIYDWDANYSLRNYTVADLQALKGQRKFIQTTANSSEEAAAARDARIDLIMSNSQNTSVVREGAPDMFLTAAISLPDFPTEKDVLTAAFAAMKDGADSIYTARGPHIVEMLAREDIPVMCHLGLVPRKSTWRGGLRAIGKTAQEAIKLWQDFKTMENAGAFSVEAEVIVSEVMEEISRRSSLLTCSLGSGQGADVVYLFQNDICGEQPKSPRHAEAFGNVHALQEQIKAERRRALSAFRTAVQKEQYPLPENKIAMDPQEHDAFLNRLAASKH